MPPSLYPTPKQGKSNFLAPYDCKDIASQEFAYLTDCESPKLRILDRHVEVDLAKTPFQLRTMFHHKNGKVHIVYTHVKRRATLSPPEPHQWPSGGSQAGAD